MAKILIIDDERSIRNSLQEVLSFEGYEVDVATDGQDGLNKTASNQYDLIFSDVKMEGIDGFEFLDKVQTSCPIIMISGHGTIEIAVDCVKRGAWDFLEKPIDLNHLLQMTKHALEHQCLHETIRRKDEELTAIKKHVSTHNQMIGQSAAIEHIRTLINKVAPSDARVLITGENGSGKEVVARLIHEQSHRANKTLVEVNCAAIPSELIESELFGHIKGSFTGAIKDRAGKFEQADGGTLFLDEIGDLSLAAQAKVLRALQESEVTRVGSDKTIHVDVRVIAATNKDLPNEIANGRFREDLFHRLNVIPIHVPPLRERRDDIPLLVEHFNKLICAEQGCKPKPFSEQAIQQLQQSEWRGNIRELRNIVERLIILAGDCITEEDVQTYTRG